MRKTKEQKGITLIALIITIIVLLILAVVAIGAVQNDGIIDHAKNAKQQYGTAQVNENTTIQSYLDKIQEHVETGTGGVATGTGGTQDEKVKISTTESYVGRYADFEGDGTIDGIIYADLAKGNTGDGQLANDLGNYTIPEETGLKDYYISRTGYVGSFGAEPRDVLTPLGDTGKERFYVMALSDVTREGQSEFYWFRSGVGWNGTYDYSTDTSGDFGAGKTNTSTMRTYWELDDPAFFGTDDLWAVIPSNSRWFLPSRAEWAAFVEELGITMETYESFGLSWCYWTSSRRMRVRLYSKFY